GEQQRHARDVAIVLARLVGAAEVDFVEPAPIDLRMARHQRFERHSRQIVGAHVRQCAAIAADRRAHRIADEGFVHCAALAWCASLVRRWRSRNTLSSASLGGLVSSSFAANFSAQPVAAATCSAVTPGCKAVTVNSLVTGSGTMTQRSVMTLVGPL